MKRLSAFCLFCVICKTLFAVGLVENRGIYSTNPRNQFGREATIVIDGDPSDWSDDMMIAQGSANDACTTFKGMHENSVLDCYALFAAWDDDNLYLAWQMVNPNDVWSREGDGPLSDGGRIADVPLIIALSIDPEAKMTGRLVGGGKLWDKVDVVYETPIDRIFMMSGKAGNGEPAMFLAADAEGNTSYDAAYCRTYRTNGITYKMGETFGGSVNYWYLNAPQDTSDVYSAASTWVDLNNPESYAGVITKAHNKKYDSFYEMKVPFAALGITKQYLVEHGIGAMMIATRGESGIDCLPHDPSMLDDVYGDYIHDKSTSSEKSDSDTIRCQLADIGCRRAGSAPAPAPSVMASMPDGYLFHGDALGIRLRAKDALTASYSIDGGATTAFDGEAQTEVGRSLPVGGTVTVSVSATNAIGTSAAEYRYTKGEVFKVASGTAIAVKPADWDEIYCYMYNGEKNNAEWPGLPMTKLSGDYYAMSLPTGWSSAKVIFNNNIEGDAKLQYPKNGGLELKAGEVKLWDWTRWYNAAFENTTALKQVETSDMTVWTLGNTLFVASNKVADCTLYNISGMSLTTLHLTEGTVAVYGLPTGIYILNGQKIIINQ